MPKTKAPDTYSAAVTARVISRKLRKAGFIMADVSDRYSWTEGYHVSRVGYGRDVSIDYYVPEHGMRDGERERRREAYKKVRGFLTDQGYVVVGPGIYITCESD